MASRPASGSRKRGVKVAKIPSRNSRSPARRLEREHPVDREKRLEELQQQCTEIKCLINSTSEENLRTRTRLMSLEKELNKRERLLQMLVKLSQANLPLGPELVEKLREERNLLPLYRRKAQDLQQLIDEREKDHKAMKRDPFFTRVIELQVEYVSWKQEGLRLEALLSDEDKDAGKKEAEVYQTRVEKLTEEREAKEKQLQKVKQELEEEEAMPNRETSMALDTF
ncbi:unnamed protein product [Effrenium voratum]|nr:unnamed protein product [Effrenium voratum]